MRIRRFVPVALGLALGLAVPASAVLKKDAPFVPFSLTNVDGTVYTVTLESGRLVLITETKAGETPQTTKSRPEAVLLDFWATWCVPCRASMPHMQAFHEKYGAGPGQEKGGLRLFGIAIDQKGGTIVKPFFAKLKFTYPMLCDPSPRATNDGLARTTREIQARYGVQTIPVVFVIDATGKITHSHVGFKPEHVAELDAAISALVSGGAK